MFVNSLFKGETHMILEQGEVIDEIITKIRAGRMTRRTFLERAVAVGLSSTAAVSLLEACGGTSNSATGGGENTHNKYLSKDNQRGYAGIGSTINKQKKSVHVPVQNEVWLSLAGGPVRGACL